jgi:hypothetical protein
MIILISNPKANRILVYNEKFEGEKKFGRFERFLKFLKFERLVLLAPVSNRCLLEIAGLKPVALNIQQQTN